MSKNAFISTAFGFEIEGSSPDVKRQQFDTVADMRACTNAPEGYISYCLSTHKHYKFDKRNDFLGYSTGYWREYNISVDLSDYATKAYVDSKTSQREVKQTTASYIANPPHKQDMDILFVVPVEGENYFTQYVATREKKSATSATISGLESETYLNGQDINSLTLANGWYGPDDSELEGWDEGDIILGDVNGVQGIFVATHDNTVVSDWELVYEAEEGDRFYTENGTCFVYDGQEFNGDKDSYNYSWLSLGTTEYNVSGKQDALTLEDGVITAMIGGVPYAINAELIAAPSIAIITPNVAEHDAYLNIQMSCATTGAKVHYTLTQDGSDPDDPTEASQQYSGTIRINADNTQQSITIKVKAIAVKYGRTSASIASKTFTIYRVCDKPVLGTVSGTDFDSTRTVTLSMTGKSPNNATIKYSKNGGSSWTDYDGTPIEITTSPTTVKAKATRNETGDVWKDSAEVSTGAIIVGQRKMYYGSLKEEPVNWTDADVDNTSNNPIGYKMTADANVFNGEFTRSFSRSAAGVTGDGYYMVVAYPKKTKTAVGDTTNKELVYADQGFMNAITAWTHIETTNYHVYYAYNEQSSSTWDFADHTKNNN